MNELIQVRCKNNKKNNTFPIASPLSAIFSACSVQLKGSPLCAKVNNVVVGMHHRVVENSDIEFLDITSQHGFRAYKHSLFFVLCKSVHDLFRGAKVVIRMSVANGYYCSVSKQTPLTYAEVEQIATRMRQLIQQDLPIVRFCEPTTQVIELFKQKKDEAKVRLLETTGQLYTTYYQLDDYIDSYYSPLITHTSLLYLFALTLYQDGLLLRVPNASQPQELAPELEQHKLFNVFKHHYQQQSILNVRTLGHFNQMVNKGFANHLINVSEALQEKELAKIADNIAKHKQVKVILIAGPSSSGKTTFCKRLSTQLWANGLHPVQLSLDDYFVNRKDTPCDEQGEYDFEHINALQISLLNEHLKKLLNGEAVEVPQYNFSTGMSELQTGNILQLGAQDLLLIEGIHALNPILTQQIHNKHKFKVYVSALTTLLLDDHNYIPTTDNRLLRRIIRDAKYRNASAVSTLKRWPSVRAGEQKWIFPFQEKADVLFNTALFFELAVLKVQAKPLLERVPENCEEYAEAQRLLSFLQYIEPINDSAIPPTSLLREFVGGSSFTY